ncbi:MAG: hypothetical protein IKD89_08570 [Clostridia bacterium]|nr:hypothetical protein [Clostridia bacterium]
MKTPHDFLLYQGYEQCHKEAYPSRHNEIYMACALNPDCMLIEYMLKSPRDIEFEAKMLTFLYENGVKVPKIMARDDKTLMIEYLRGGTLVDTLADCEKNGGDFTEAASALRDWLVSFHKVCAGFPDAKITSAGDLSLTNFTLAPAGVVYGYDFENGDYTGSFEDDLHTLAAEILLCDKCSAEFKSAAARALLGGDYDKNRLDAALERVCREQGIENKPDVKL